MSEISFSLCFVGILGCWQTERELSGPLWRCQFKSQNTIHFLEGPPHDKYWHFHFFFLSSFAFTGEGRGRREWETSFNESGWKFEAITGLWCPLDVLGRTRNTLMKSTSLFYFKMSMLLLVLMFWEPWPKGLGNLADKLHRAGDRSLIQTRWRSG